MSFFHGSNDGQKGMGLIMLILIGVAPTAYALNRSLPASDDAGVPGRRRRRRRAVFQAHAGGAPAPGAGGGAQHGGRRAEGQGRERTRRTMPRWATLIGQITVQVKDYGAIKSVPAAQTPNVRNDMYLASDDLRVMGAKSGRVQRARTWAS